MNELGEGSANSLMTSGRDLPYLQDGDQNANTLSDVWTESWQVQWRDVIILNGANEKVFTYNLTVNNLGLAANYQTLRNKLVEVAIDDQRPWCNPQNVLDVDQNGSVQQSDFTQVLNFLNQQGPQSLNPAQTPTARIDCNFDGFASPIDALHILNHLNSLANGEGEPLDEPLATPPVAAFFASFESLPSSTDSAPTAAVGSPAAVDAALHALLADPFSAWAPATVQETSSESLVEAPAPFAAPAPDDSTDPLDALLR